ncbi:DegV family protein [Brevibacterium jeotgali]|uniref:EDD domain protein, DegV family n=1 Tax=Brevibacterium jeotgali TaxID=1262550 RepID=A0A2H1L2F3_9MICO|nr:DegV family protein [Brevibacterium jeotgali]TWC03006.1 DegV family protein with EDD domain [Brevibacterium jeotgali]SMY11029.1 EDD domain protein, DegV family [Brevibacterium jeotgali]
MTAADAAHHGRPRRPGEDDGASGIGLVVDSTVLLTPAERARVSRALGGRFAVVPLSVIVDEVEHIDGELAPSALCDAMVGGARVSTSMPAVHAFTDAFEQLRERGSDHIIVLTLSAALSGTHGTAESAGHGLDVPLTVIDTRTTSAAAGGAALVIADGVAEGRGPAALRSAAEDYLRDETFVVFCPATLEHLERGGRIGRAASLLGRALSIVPVLGLRDGLVDATARVRTVRKAHARMIADALAAARAMGSVDVTVLVSEGSLDDAGDAARGVHAQMEAAARAEGWGISADVLSPVLTAHVGPGAVGIVVRGRS